MIITATTNTTESLFDLVLNTYGDVSYTFKLMEDNSNVLPDIAVPIVVGMQIIWDDAFVFTNESNVTAPPSSFSAVSTYYRAKENQSLFDLAIQLYGDVSQLFTLIQDNPIIGDVNNPNLEGTMMLYKKQTYAATEYFLTNNISITTGAADNGRSFDDSFSFSFN